MLNILITGASGFVGQHLQKYLSETGAYTISSLSLRQPFTEKELNGSDVVIHLAGKAHDLKNISGPEEYYKVNFELTKKLYDAFLVSKASKFIFMSSVKAAADHVESALEETQAPSPVTAYGKSKLMAEEYIRNQSLPPGKSCFVLRPCMIHGPGNKGNLNLLYKIVTTRIPWPLAAFHNQRSFLSIGNLCFVVKEIVERDDIPGGTYHVADDESLSTNKLIEIIAGELGIGLRTLSIPRSLVSAVARLGDIIKLPLNTERLHKLTENYVVSNRKLVKALKKELPVSATEGIKTTIRSFKNKRK